MKGEGKTPEQESPLIYPSIKPANVMREIKVGIIKSGILPRAVKDAIYFREDYRFDPVVIDSLAAKYDASTEKYPQDDKEENEHFLLGCKACEDSAAGLLSSPHIKKVWEVLRKEKISRKKVFSIYLLGLDDSEDNEQRFVILSKDKVYLRWETKKLETIDYSEIAFDEDGIRSIRLIPRIEGENDGYLLKYSFDERFLAFAMEIHLLKETQLSGIEETHPAGGLPKEKVSKYFSFLVEVAACSKRFDVRRLLRLEYLAKEFLIGADVLEKGLRSVKAGRVTDTKLVKKFYEIHDYVTPEEIRYVFYQELLDFCTSDSGDAEQEKVHGLIKKAAGEAFVMHYCAFLKAHRAAEHALCAAFQHTRVPELNLREMYRLQRYDDALKLQALRTGVKINGRETGI